MPFSAFSARLRGSHQHPYSAAQNTVPKIGYLTPNAQGVPLEQGFHQGLRELGYSEGSSIIIEWRRAKDREDLAAPLAFELVQRQVDLIVTVGTSAARAALDATATIPIVFLSGAPVSSGLTTSIARPDRNATGISLLTSELFAKRLEYLHWLAPRLDALPTSWSPPTPYLPRRSKRCRRVRICLACS